MIGVVWTFIAATVKEFRGKGLLALEAGHAVIWLLFNFSPELLGKAIGLVIALPIAILVGVVGLSFFRGLSADDSAPAMPGRRMTAPRCSGCPTSSTTGATAAGSW